MHKDLRLSGQLPPLDAPHHMRATQWGQFREGVVLASAPGAGSLLDIGLDKLTPALSAHGQHSNIPSPMLTQISALEEEARLMLTLLSTSMEAVQLCNQHLL